jgi:C1A family cysteine protease
VGSGKKLISAINYKNNITPTELQALIAAGPVSVGVDASSEFQKYKTGIYTGVCAKSNHAVTAIGYGVEDGVSYYLVRNSWAETWGEGGYIKIGENAANNACLMRNEVHWFK